MNLAGGGGRTSGSITHTAIDITVHKKWTNFEKLLQKAFQIQVKILSTLENSMQDVLENAEDFLRKWHSGN